MKFTISKIDLLEAINIVSKGRSGRSTLPILSGIFIKATSDSIVLQTTDLEINVKHVCPALVEKQGETVIPGKLITNIVKSLPDAAIDCEIIGEQFQITCMNSSFNLNMMDPKDFPSFPEIDINQSVVINTADISNIVKKVSKAVSRDESHVILTGINMTIDNGLLTIAATDSYRLAISELQIPDYQENFSLIVPGLIFDEVCKIAPNNSEMLIGYNENQILFQFDNSTFITRKLEGKYPNYKQIIPQEKSTSAIVDTRLLTEAVKRISIMATEYSQIKLFISPDLQQILISSKAADLGGAEEKIDAQVEGEEITIGFNYQYIIDGLSSIDSDEVVIEVNNPLRPGVFKDLGGDGFFYLSMPVKLNV